MTGDDETRARSAIAAIAHDLRARTPAWLGLGAGAAGWAIFEAAIAELAPSPEPREAVERLQQAVDLAGQAENDASLYTGLAGLGFAATLLSRPIGLNLEDLCGPLDVALVELVEAERRGDFDLIGGLVGLGVYGLERVRAGADDRLIRGVVRQLRCRAIPGDVGLVWINPSLASNHPGSFGIDLGVAHGLGGVVGFLASCLENGIESDLSATLLEGAIATLRAHQVSNGVTSRFPAVVRPGEAPRPARLAWCYGDAGVALALHRAGSAADRPEWARLAQETARLAANRLLDDTGVTDAGLCHGAAGLAHVFNRLYQATGDDTLRAAALRWFRHALGQWSPGVGVGGFRADWKGPAEWQAEVDAGFLEGAAGIGLALSAAILQVEPTWDRALLLS